MTSEPTNRIEISGVSNAPIVTGGENHGTISGGTIQYGATPEQLGDLIGLLTRLKTEVGRSGVEKREVIEDNLDDLAEDVRNPAEANPAVALSRWEKVKKLLAGAGDFTELIGKISESVGKIFA
ncbi:hypothetical protein [Amycolatopsis keratiniphila]|uniref:hypothetical protein n=1 Tax=Amycolatopsis keratiniphila TaxID=129921 RepID=UPI00087942E2|nr:hypothetical protein [Amycolatopsis keratiniphila]OLZ54215.1 hypothetical protein BS330_21825 [Amycolatopsis keratiniphila subsp. nogabecina]SDU63501.1 hypothetical protein SAMN04489733_7409 [Amycolatopsis keratiniphila]